MRLLLSCTLLGAVWTCSASAAEKLSVGDPAPKFTLKDDQGKTWKSEEHFGDGWTVVYFYPADMTGGCTAQACSFRDDLGSLKEQGIQVVGISGDTVENHKLFKQAENLNFTLLADVNGEVADKFGVPYTKGEKSIVRTIGGEEHTLTRGATISRWTFIIDPDGKIAAINPNVNAAQDSENVAETIAELKKKRS